jgi:hypothetical protein
MKEGILTAMIASQFNLDQRLAELLETGPASYQTRHASSASASLASRLGAAIRSIFGGQAARTTRLAAN